MRILCNAKDSNILSTKNNSVRLFTIFLFEILTMSLILNNWAQIEIEAVRGSGYQSDIAIDSVHLTNGKCETGVDVRDIGLEHIGTDVKGESFQSCSGHILGDNCDHISKYHSVE